MGWINKCPMHGLTKPLRNKKGQTADIHNNMDKSQKQCDKKKEAKQQTTHWMTPFIRRSRKGKSVGTETRSELPRHVSQEDRSGRGRVVF